MFDVSHLKVEGVIKMYGEEISLLLMTIVLILIAEGIVHYSHKYAGG